MLLAAVITSCRKEMEKTPLDKTRSAPETTTDMQKNEEPLMNYLSPQREGC